MAEDHVLQLEFLPRLRALGEPSLAGLVLAVIMGRAGSLQPATRAAGMPIVEARKSE